MQNEQLGYEVWRYVANSEGADWEEANRRMELGWLEAEEDIDDLDTMSDPEAGLEEGALDDFEEGFIRGFTAAA